MGKTYNARKRKVKKNVPEGQAHIHATFNNTIISITDPAGNAISWSAPGAVGFKKNYCTMGFVYDNSNLLKLKQSPFDCGPEVATKLISKGVWL